MPNNTTLIKTLLLCFCTVGLVGMSFAANTIRRGNLIIDLDTGKITIANDNTEYQSLLTDGSDTKNTTGSITQTGTTTNQPTNTTPSNQSGSSTVNTSGGSIATTPQTPNKPTTSSGSELENAIYRGYVNELTIFDSINDFKPNDAITREQAAKFFSQAATALNYSDTYTGNCVFNDTANSNETLKSFISKVCTLGLMKGNGISFRPEATITKAETITILSRLAGFRSTTVSNPRRQQYYDFINPINIFPSDFSLSTIDKASTRGDMMVMLYKLSQKKSSGLSSSSDSSTNNNSTTSPSPLSVGAGIGDDPEFRTALLWMNSVGMTKHWKASDYNPLVALTREQSAQFFSLYDQKFDTNNTSGGTCNLQDISSSTFQTAINYVCSKGILNGGKNLFRPSDAMTKAEFTAGVLNMLKEPFTGSGSRQSTVYKKALALEIVNRSDEATFDKPITRYEVAIIFHKLYLKDQFKKALSDNTANYTVISPIETDTTTYSGNQEKVTIDINSIDNKDFTNGFVTLFGENYKLSKKQVTQYFPTSYAWHGELIDITEDKVIGSISMSIGQQGIRKTLIDGYIVIENNGGYYTIQNTDQIGRYIITKAK